MIPHADLWYVRFRHVFEDCRILQLRNISSFLWRAIFLSTFALSKGPKIDRERWKIRWSGQYISRSCRAACLRVRRLLLLTCSLSYCSLLQSMSASASSFSFCSLQMSGWELPFEMDVALYCCICMDWMGISGLVWSVEHFTVLIKLCWLYSGKTRSQASKLR